MDFRKSDVEKTTKTWPLERTQFSHHSQFKNHENLFRNHRYILNQLWTVNDNEILQNIGFLDKSDVELWKSDVELLKSWRGKDYKSKDHILHIIPVQKLSKSV